jgi:hypothetical protein
MRMQRAAPVTAAVLGAYAVTGALTGCSGMWSPVGPDADRGRAAVVARDRVADLARSIGDEKPDDVFGYARAAVREVSPETGGESSGIDLIGIDELQSERFGEPIGRLEFRVTDAFAAGSGGVGAPDDADTSATEFCFRVTFDHYGKVGDWSTSDGVDAFDCPADAAPVTPPVDTTLRAVVAVNAREAAREVLSERAATGSPQDSAGIAAAILARLEPPAGEYEVLAEPVVVVESGASGTAVGPAGDRVGVAMGRAESCVLMKLDDGIVADVRPPAVLLQPGELGCTPETALADPEQLRSPH